MSANNWGICPRCRGSANKQQRENEKKMIDAYGKVKPEDYERLRATVLRGVELEETLREDYEQGMNKDGKYFLRYYCQCRVCGFNWKFEHDEKVAF